MNVIAKRADIAALDSLSACSEAKKYVASRSSLSDAWRTCERGDWMLWLIARVLWRDSPTPFGSIEHRRMIACLYEIIATNALPFANDERVFSCAETLRAYAEGSNCDPTALARAAGAAARAARAAGAAAWAARAARAAEAAAWAAEADSLRCSAEIVRVWYPNAPTIVRTTIEETK